MPKDISLAVVSHLQLLLRIFPALHTSIFGRLLSQFASHPLLAFQKSQILMPKPIRTGSQSVSTFQKRTADAITLTSLRTRPNTFQRRLVQSFWSSCTQLVDQMLKKLYLNFWADILRQSDSCRILNQALYPVSFSDRSCEFWHTNYRQLRPRSSLVSMPLGSSRTQKSRPYAIGSSPQLESNTLMLKHWDQDRPLTFSTVLPSTFGPSPLNSSSLLRSQKVVMLQIMLL